MIRHWLCGLNRHSRSHRASSRRRPDRGRRAATVEDLEGRTLLSGTYTVTLTGHNPATVGTLPWAVKQADSHPGSVIDFGSLFDSPQTITLNATLNLTANVTIEGPGAANLTVSGGDQVRVFSVGGGVNADIKNLTIAHGYDAEDGGGVLNQGSLNLGHVVITANRGGFEGGGIENLGNLTVNHSTVSGNGADLSGGGLCDYGSTLSILNSTFSGNSVGALGDGGNGGALFASGRNASVANCTFAGNTATFDGGAIEDWPDAAGPLAISNSTFDGNTAMDGGALEVYDVANVTNCTFAGNVATDNSSGGGAIHVGWVGTLTAVNDTVAYNQGHGGGLSVDAGGVASLYNTIVALNTQTTWQGVTSPDDIVGAVSSSSACNLIGTGGSGGLVDNVNGNLVGVANPGLAGGLADNGGPTQTIALLADSPAIDAGSDNILGITVPTVDQRGVARPSGRIDIGAYQYST
jgi:predicted outer membrane repeat protein